MTAYLPAPQAPRGPLGRYGHVTQVRGSVRTSGDAVMQDLVHVEVVDEQLCGQGSVDLWVG